MIGVNTLSSLDQPVYANHCQAWFRMGRNMTDYDFALNAPRRASIDRMRNQTAELAIAHGFDYACFIDDDILIPFDGLQRLVAADKDVIAGWTIIRGYPFDNMIFKWDEKKEGLLKWNDFPEKEGLLEVGAIGFSFALIKTSVLKAMPPPYFVTGPHNTEDIYFCVKAQRYIPDLKIHVDLSVKTAHCLGPDYINPDNKQNFVEFYKVNYPELTEDSSSGERGNSYLMDIKRRAEEISIGVVDKIEVDAGVSV